MDKTNNKNRTGISKNEVTHHRQQSLGEKI